MKNCVINALKFVTFDFFKEYFLNLVSLKSATGALVNKTLIVICCLFIVMVENAHDDPIEKKPIFVDNFREFTPPKVEAKPNIYRASVHVETSYVDSGVAPFGVDEVDTTRFFSSEVKSKDRDNLLNWVHRQANMVGFTIVIRISNLKNPMLQLLCERSGDHKALKKYSSLKQHAQENVGVCLCCMDILVEKQMIGDFIFLMEFTTMR